MLNLLNVIEVLWPLLIAFGSFVLYKVIPYLRTKIYTNKFRNENVILWLVEYEMIVSMAMQFLILLIVFKFGKSTWEKLVLIEYASVWVLLTILYVIGIVGIIRYRKKEGEKKYLVNIILGGIVHIALSGQAFLIVMDLSVGTLDLFFYLFVFGILLMQAFVNFDPIKVKNVKCLVYADKKKPYHTPYEPIKRGKYYYIRITDEDKNEIKRIQILDERIWKIEYIIENLEKE